MNKGDPGVVAEDEFVRLAQADFCSVPGYLVLRVKTGDESAGALQPAAAAVLGGHLARATAAIETATGADRVYCLSFGEVDRRLHYHLFPRTAELLAAYHRATGTAAEPVNGPLLFEWARASYVPGGAPAPGPDPGAVIEHLRRLLS